MSRGRNRLGAGAAIALVAAALLALATPAAAQLSFSSPTPFSTDDGPNTAQAGDFDGDGDPDLAVANGLKNSVSVLTGQPGGSFAGPNNLAVGTGPVDVDLGFFDAGSDLDLVTANLTSDNFSVLIGAVGASFAAAQPYPAGDNARKTAVADYDGDGDLDLAVTILSNINIALGAGDGSFGTPTNAWPAANPPGNPRDIAVGRFDAGADPDLVAADFNTHQLLVLLGAPAGTFGAPTPIQLPAGSAPREIAVADLNGDGNQDLAVANPGAIPGLDVDNVSVLLGSGDGKFGSPTPYPAGTDPVAVGVSDFNGDGLPDLAVGNATSDNVSILLGQGAGNFADAVSFPSGDSPEPFAAGDFNADGKPDLAVPNNIVGVAPDTISILLNQTPFPVAPGPPAPPAPCCAPPRRRLADLPDPVQGVTTNVEPVGRGAVFVGIPARLAGARTAGARASQKGVAFVPLREARQVPMGSFLDTRRGRVRLQTARDRRGTRQQGDFSAGLFQVLQSRRRSARGLTSLVLKGSSFRSCRRGGRGKGSVRSAGSRLRRRLRANARGRFRTRGRHSAATVRGTVWLTADRCDGTLTKVTRGRVAVRDFRRKRTILLRAGKRYLARASR